MAASLSSRGRLLPLDTPRVMGILNATPDSFFKSTLSIGLLMEEAEKMLRDGADILDIGGASTRPGADEVPGEEELRRVLPLVEALSKNFPEAWLSVDTYRARVAAACVDAGVHIVNDVCAGRDPEMLPTVARLRTPYIAMHMQGSPRNMQVHPQYADVVREVFDFLKESLLRCRAAGIQDLVLDPGFGFGKTRAHNFALLNELSTFRALGCPLLVGLSRKRMICETLGLKPAEAGNGSTALHMVALREGASILRTHDVKEARECVRLFQALEGQE